MGINLKRDITGTIMSKSLILLLNFAVVVMTTHFWGDTGRGSIAIFVADLSMVNIFANVFTGSSVSYFFSRMGKSKIATTAYLWTFIVSAAGGLALLLAGETKLAPLLFFASAMSGIVAFNNSLFIGGQKIGHYNLVTILQPALLIAFMLLFKTAFPGMGYFSYFFGLLCSLAVLLLVCRHLRHKDGIYNNWDLDFQATKEMFSFGWKTELSSLLQFVNYRLTYYMLDIFIGRGSVGVFSIGVTLAEAIWIVSRSMSMVQFSNVLKAGDTVSTRRETTKIALLSLGISAICVVAVVMLPGRLFAFVFGEAFSDVGRVVMLLAPGILAIAFSNVLGNFLSATRQLNILIAKSAVGVVFTVALSFVLIPKMQVDGACIVNSVSYIVSSLTIALYYYLGRKKA
ncbi:MAG: polysaccharide biosynthesis C-terminal domain-containing protein [Bacteroidales bacterium]|nr:polysaccharide biosynthesis C-terminal domain-containing protein [Bacteroidales bacterium]